MNLLGLLLAVGVALLAVGAMAPIRGNELVPVASPSRGRTAAPPSGGPGLQLTLHADQQGYDWNSVMEKVVVLAVSYIPIIGNVVAFFVDLFWPSSTTDIWSTIVDQTQELVDQAILKYEVQERTGELNALQKTMRSYVKAKSNEKGTIMSTMKDDCDETSYKLMHSSNTKQLLPITIAMAHMHLAILRERLQHGNEIFTENNTAVWEEELKDQWAEYREYFRATYPLWASWRAEKITMDAHIKSNPYKSYCKVTDGLTGEEIYYKGVNGKSLDLAGMCKAIKERMLNDAKAEMIGMIMERSFHINMYLPGLENAPPDVDPAIQNFTMGPISGNTMGIGSDYPFEATAWDTPGRVTAIEACWLKETGESLSWDGIATLQFTYEGHTGKVAGSTKGQTCGATKKYTPLSGTHFTGMNISNGGPRFDWIQPFYNTTAMEKFPADGTIYYEKQRKQLVCDPSFEMVGLGWDDKSTWATKGGYVPLISLQFQHSSTIDTAAALGSSSHWADYMDILADRASSAKKGPAEKLTFQLD